MKIATFKKRFDFPINLIASLQQAMVFGKNGKMYFITKNRKNEPVAKIVKTNIL